MSFGEILVIVFVALIVLGPKQLPVVARRCGQYWAQLQNLWGTLKNNFAQELKLEELQRNIARATAAEKRREQKEESVSPHD